MEVLKTVLSFAWVVPIGVLGLLISMYFYGKKRMGRRPGGWTEVGLREYPLWLLSKLYVQKYQHQSKNSIYKFNGSYWQYRIEFPDINRPESLASMQDVRVCRRKKI